MHLETPQQKKLSFVSKLLGVLMLLVGALVFSLACIAIAEREKVQDLSGHSSHSRDLQEDRVATQGQGNKAGSEGEAEGPEKQSDTAARAWWEQLVPFLLIALVFLLLLIPAVWIYHFHALWREGPGVGREDYLAWVTAIGVPYFILGFAMVVEFHALIEDRRIGVGAIAAIMILYALSVLASFLYIEVRELKKSFEANVAAASKWFSLSLTLAEADAGQRSPAASITDLLTTWSTIYSHGKEGPPTPRRNLRRNAIGTLLSTYVREESNDLRGALSADKVPASVWPWPESMLSEESPPAGISFIASNTSYYAKFLQEAVQHLPSAMREHSGVFLATITCAPPPLWWNWHSSDLDGYIYSPIEDYRRTLIEIAGGADTGSRATIFRKVVLSDDGWRSDKLISLQDWNEMRGWNFLRLKDIGEPMRSDRRALPREYERHCIQGLKWTDFKVTTERKHAYWVVDHSAEPLPAYGDFDLVKINDHFAEVMHPQGRGVTEIYSIPETLFREPLLEGGVPGLNRCSEMLFLGLSRKKGSQAEVWTEADPDLALAMLTTMSPNSETTFITVVWGEDRLQELWSAIRRASTRFPAALETLRGGA